jgi:small subunit ribosomal protein S8e
MGISRDSTHKRRKSGGRRKAIRNKRKFEAGRPPANTRIGPKRVRPTRVRGGNTKWRALRLEAGNYSWGTECMCLGGDFSLALSSALLCGGT